MPISTAAIGERIAVARVQAGLTQAELAAAASLDRTAVAKIESGTRGVSAAELAAFADVLHLRMEWFIDDGPPALVSHRVRQESTGSTSVIDQTIERVARAVEVTASLDATLFDRVLESIEVPNAPEEAEALAQNVRATIGLTEEQPVLDLVAGLSSVGLLAFSFPLGDDAADAATILLGRGAVSVINSAGKVGRRRLALAHEAGHYLFADEFTIDWRVEEHVASRIESTVERFARALLLPSLGLGNRWRDFFESEDLRTCAIRVASHFRVDMSTLATRLGELDLASAEQTAQIRGVRTTKADIVELDLYVPFDLEGTSLPRAYQRSVLHLYRSELISGERALELMFGTFDDSGLPMLPDVSPQEIWQFTS